MNGEPRQEHREDGNTREDWKPRRVSQRPGRDPENADEAHQARSDHDDVDECMAVVLAGRDQLSGRGVEDRDERPHGSDDEQGGGVPPEQYGGCHDSMVAVVNPAGSTRRRRHQQSLARVELYARCLCDSGLGGRRSMAAKGQSAARPVHGRSLVGGPVWFGANGHRVFTNAHIGSAHPLSGVPKVNKEKRHHDVH